MASGLHAPCSCWLAFFILLMLACMGPFFWKVLVGLHFLFTSDGLHTFLKNLAVGLISFPKLGIWLDFQCITEAVNGLT